MDGIRTEAQHAPPCSCYGTAAFKPLQLLLHAWPWLRFLIALGLAGSWSWLLCYMSNGGMRLCMLAVGVVGRVVVVTFAVAQPATVATPTDRFTSSFASNSPHVFYVVTPLTNSGNVSCFRIFEFATFM